MRSRRTPAWRAAVSPFQWTPVAFRSSSGALRGFSDSREPESSRINPRIKRAPAGLSLFRFEGPEGLSRTPLSRIARLQVPGNLRPTRLSTRLNRPRSSSRRGLSPSSSGGRHTVSESRRSPRKRRLAPFAPFQVPSNLRIPGVSPGATALQNASCRPSKGPGNSAIRVIATCRFLGVGHRGFPTGDIGSPTGVRSERRRRRKRVPDRWSWTNHRGKPTGLCSRAFHQACP